MHRLKTNNFGRKGLVEQSRMSHHNGAGNNLGLHRDWNLWLLEGDHNSTRHFAAYAPDH